eukprot:symbB.v1.2.018181.t1/scaffold1436.1/size118852/4
MTSSQVPSVSTVEQEVDGRTQVEPRLPSLLQKAMACPGLKADILDVVAGAPYEFAVHGNVEDHEGFFRLPRLAAAAQNGKKTVRTTPFSHQAVVYYGDRGERVTEGASIWAALNATNRGGVGARGRDASTTCLTASGFGSRTARKAQHP